MVPILQIYAALIDRIEAADIMIRVNGRLGGEQEAGYFDSKLMVIAVWRTQGGIRGRDKIIATVQKPLDETITLAHEFGHYESFAAGLAPGYEEARDLFGAEQAAVPVPASRLTAAQKRFVLGEEQLAWSYGRAALKRLGFADWVAFDSRERDGLAEYRRRLGLTDT